MLTHEQRLYLINRPTVLLFATLVKRFDSVHVPGIGYAVSDPLLAAAILKHPHFRSNGHGAMGPLIDPLVGKYGLFNMDGDEHTRLKRELMTIFQARYVESVLDAALTPLLVQLQADLRAGTTVDIVTLTRQLTTRVMLHLMGIDVETADSDRIGVAVDDAVTSFTRLLNINRFELKPAEIARLQAKHQHIFDLLDAHGHDQPDGLRARLRDLGLSDDDARGLVTVMAAAGTETTNAALPRILALLIDHGQYALLQDDPTRVPQAVEEGLRMVATSPVIIRAITQDTTLNGHHFKAGRRALLLLYNILKQERYLAGATRFDIAHQIPAALKHLAFGHGPHFCLGFPLAVREIERTIAALLALDGQPRIVARRYPRDETFPGYQRLLIRLEQNR